MKILAINDSPLNTGVGEYVNILYDAMNQSPVQFRLLNLKFVDGNYWKGETIDMRRFTGNVKNTGVTINRMVAATLGRIDLRNYDYDIIHATALSVPLFLKQRPDFVTVHHLNPLLGSPFYSRTTRYATKMAANRSAKWSTLIVMSNFMRDLIRKYVSLDAAVHVVYPYYNVRVTQTPEIKMNAGSNLGIPQSAKVIIAVGTSAPIKNFLTLYNAVRGKDYYVLRVGGWREEEVKTFRWDIPEQVHFLSEKEKVPDSKVLQAYLASDVLVFTSVDEGFGRPLVEAMTVGLPVIGNRCTTVPEIIGDAGILVKDPYNSSEISSALQRVFSDIETYAEKSRERRRMFDKKIFVQQMKEIYESKK